MREESRTHRDFRAEPWKGEAVFRGTKETGGGAGCGGHSLGEHMRFGLGACEVWDAVPAFQVELASRQVYMTLGISGEV